MYYLRYVVLRMAQERAHKNQNGLGILEAGASRENPWNTWISSLLAEGIQVISAEGAGQGEASLWITDDESFAKECVRCGRPVLGVLTEDNAGQGFDGVSYLVSDLVDVEPQYLEKVYRRQAGIPWDVLETERCLLRETIAGDADAFYEIYADPSVTKHVEDLPKDRDAFTAWLQDYAKSVYEFLGYGIWTVCLKQETLDESLAVIGRAGLTVREGYDAPELGFVIGKPWQGQGLAYEICCAILDYAREQGIPEVIAFAEPGNEASRKLLQKLGFQMTDWKNLDWHKTDCQEQVLQDLVMLTMHFI
ncbi:MAG: GNAT family N-acetyltransferase [Lachnospiraceae bacterium]|nr:GNAT family N-acetyltransferase [Lachnospiraceae bacterium]